MTRYVNPAARHPATPATRGLAGLSRGQSRSRGPSRPWSTSTPSHELWTASRHVRSAPTARKGSGGNIELVLHAQHEVRLALGVRDEADEAIVTGREVERQRLF